MQIERRIARLEAKVAGLGDNSVTMIKIIFVDPVPGGASTSRVGMVKILDLGEGEGCTFRPEDGECEEEFLERVQVEHDSIHGLSIDE